MTGVRFAYVLTGTLILAADAALGQMHNHSRQPATAAAMAAVMQEANVAVEAVTEDRQRLLRATVTAEGKPLENVIVAFYVRRTFGNMMLGQDQTLDDGTAAVPFPEGLPGGKEGEFHVIAMITASPRYAGRAEAVVEGGAIIPPETNPFPRALWAPRAPWALITAILVLLVGAWGTFGYVIAQLFRIPKEGRQ